MIPQIIIAVEKQDWNPAEDVVLINAWLNTSTDPIRGNKPKTNAFQKHTDGYHSRSTAVANMPTWEWNNCMQRWQKINDSVCKFVGCYDQDLSQRTSGQSEDNVNKVHTNSINNDYNINFTLEHA